MYNMKKYNKWRKLSYMIMGVSLTFTFSLSNIEAKTQQTSKSSSLSNTTGQEERVIVVFKNQSNKTEIEKVKKIGKTKHQYKNINAVSMSVPATAISGLKNNPNVAIVEQDVVVKVKTQTQDWGIPKTKATQSWSSGLTGKGVKVAVIDTGVSSHEDLLVSGGKSVVSYTTSYQDDNGHGTHVAGIISAENNSIGVVGIAPDSQIYAVKALDSNGSGYLSDIIAGVDWAIVNDMDIANMSLGTTYNSSTLQQVVDKAYNSGVLVIAAAGNDSGAVNYPAKYSSAIAVSATDQNNNLASFSSRGPEVEVSAPGVSILSTYPGNRYVSMSGTSMATPYAAGNLALLKQKYPTISHTELRTKLQQSVIDLGTSGRDGYFGYGLIQAPIQEQVSTIATPSNFKATNITSSSVSLSWDVVSNASKYKLYRNSVVIFEGTLNSFNASGLTSNTNYQFDVVAIDVNGVASKPATIFVKTLQVAPTTPANFTASNVTNNSVTLSWSPSKDASSYELKRNNVVIYKGSYTSFVEQNLSSNATYYYEVVAINSAGISSPAKLTVTTKLATTTQLVANAYTNYSYYYAGEYVYIYVYSKDSSGKIVPSSNVTLTVTQPNGYILKGQGTTDSYGRAIFVLGTNIYSPGGIYKIKSDILKSGYVSGSASTSFQLYSNFNSYNAKSTTKTNVKDGKNNIVNATLKFKK